MNAEGSESNLGTRRIQKKKYKARKALTMTKTSSQNSSIATLIVDSIDMTELMVKVVAHEEPPIT